MAVSTGLIAPVSDIDLESRYISLNQGMFFPECSICCHHVSLSFRWTDDRNQLSSPDAGNLIDNITF